MSPDELTDLDGLAHTAADPDAVLSGFAVAGETRHAVGVGHRFDLGSAVEQLLGELCIGLGFCLPPDEIRQLCESPPKTVDSFTDAVFDAEGMGDMSYTDLRRQVREVVARHMNRWIAYREQAANQ
jgi:hypothetical protein